MYYYYRRPRYAEFTSFGDIRDLLSNSKYIKTIKAIASAQPIAKRVNALQVNRGVTLPNRVVSRAAITADRMLKEPYRTLNRAGRRGVNSYRGTSGNIFNKSYAALARSGTVLGQGGRKAIASAQEKLDKGIVLVQKQQLKKRDKAFRLALKNTPSKEGRRSLIKNFISKERELFQAQLPRRNRVYRAKAIAYRKRQARKRINKLQKYSRPNYYFPRFSYA